MTGEGANPLLDPAPIPNYLWSWAQVTIYERLKDKRLAAPGSNNAQIWDDLSEWASDPVEGEAAGIVRLAWDTFPFVTQVTVKQQMSMVESITINLDMPFQEGLDLFNGKYRGILKGGNMVRVVLGYQNPALTSRVFLGQFQRGGSGLSISPEGVSGTMTAVGVMVQGQQKYALPADWNSQSFEERFQMMAKRCGYAGVQFSNRAIATMEDKMIAKPELATNTGSWQPIAWMQKTCLDLGLSWKTTTFDAQDRIYVQVMAVNEWPSVRTIFAMRGNALEPLEDGTAFPIVSLSPEIPDVVFQGGRSPHQGFVVNGDVLENGEVNVVSTNSYETAEKRDMISTLQGPPSTNPAEDTKVGPNAEQTTTEAKEPAPEEAEAATDPDKNPEKVGTPVFLNRRQVVFDKDAAKEATVTHTMQFVESTMMNLVTTGCLHLQINEVVQVVGCGQFLDGFYRVLGFTHTWQDGVIETSVSMQGWLARFGKEDKEWQDALKKANQSTVEGDRGAQGGWGPVIEFGSGGST